MDYEIFSYRYAREIIEHKNYNYAYDEIRKIISDCPLFVYPNKSKKNKRLDVVQQLFNTYYDRQFVCNFDWEFHPDATKIPGSKLKADYRKNFGGLRIQAEVQFGNMARWYSDIFKFQTAYSQGEVDMGLSIIPMSQISKRMDSNVANFERCRRELPSAQLSITLPILLIGLKVSDQTALIDVSKAKFSGIADITGRGKTKNRYRIINAIFNKTQIKNVSLKSATGKMASSSDLDEDED